MLGDSQFFPMLNKEDETVKKALEELKSQK